MVSYTPVYSFAHTLRRNYPIFGGIVSFFLLNLIFFFQLAGIFYWYVYI